MAISFSALNTYGRSTIGNVEGAFGSLNITRDPPRSYFVPNRVKVGDTSAITSEIGNSGSRICEAIRKYPRGVNPAVDVSYGNYAESGVGGVQAHPPYKIMDRGAFRPPVMSQQELLPISRQVRGSTSASTKVQHVDHTLRPVTSVNPHNAREIHRTIPITSTLATASYPVQRPVSAPVIPPAAAVRASDERLSFAVSSGIRMVDLSTLVVKTPDGTVTDRRPTTSLSAPFGSETVRREAPRASIHHHQSSASGNNNVIRAKQHRALPSSMWSRVTNAAAAPHGLGDFGGRISLSEAFHTSASTLAALGYVGKQTVVRKPAQNIADHSLKMTAVPRASLPEFGGSIHSVRTPTASLVKEADLLRSNTLYRGQGGLSHVGTATKVQNPSTGIHHAGPTAPVRNVTAVLGRKNILSSADALATGDVNHTAAARDTADILRVESHPIRSSNRGGAGLASRVSLGAEMYVRDQSFSAGKNVLAGLRGNCESAVYSTAHAGEKIRETSMSYPVATARTTTNENSHSSAAASASSAPSRERKIPQVRAQTGRTAAHYTTPIVSTKKTLRNVVAPGGFTPNDGAPAQTVNPAISLGKRRGSNMLGFASYSGNPIERDD